MKKKMLECNIHGYTLFRCKRRYWARGSKKDKGFADEYTEKCFKCIEEGRYKRRIIISRRGKHISLRE